MIANQMSPSRFLALALGASLLIGSVANVFAQRGIFYCPKPDGTKSIQDKPCPLAPAIAGLEPVRASVLTEAVIREAMRRFDQAQMRRDVVSISKTLSAKATMNMHFKDGGALRGGADEIKMMFRVSLSATEKMTISHSKVEVQVKGDKGYFRALTKEVGVMGHKAFDSESVEITEFELINGEIKITGLNSAPLGDVNKKRSLKSPEWTLPDRVAPAGYSWAAIREIRLGLLLPTGWSIKQTREGSGYIILLSASPTSGFSLLVHCDPGHGPMNPNYAESFIQGLLSKIGASNLRRTDRNLAWIKGVVLGFDTNFGATNARKTHMNLLFNEQTGTQYLFMANAPIGMWPDVWRMVEPIFANIYLDDEF
jgi:hypothetical protein